MKKILCVALVAILLLSAFLLCASADDEVSVGYSENNIVKPDDLSSVRNILDINKYPNETAYKVNSAEGLLRVATAVRQDFYSFEDVTIYLTKDVDMKDIAWTPIGTTTSSYFGGTFDGLGHIISNLVYDNKATTGDIVPTGLFGVAKGATIKNLVIDSTCSFSFSGNGSLDNRTGSLIGWAGPSTRTMTIENVMSLATVKGVRYTGGLIGQHDGNPNTQLDIKNTTFAGSVKSPGCAGGFVGFFQGRVSIENSWNAGSVTSTTSSVDRSNAVGGFVGRARPRGELETYVIKKCVNTGMLTGGAIGGIIGSSEMNVTSIVIEGCTTYGSLVDGENITTASIKNAFYAVNIPVDPCPSDGVPVVKSDCEDKTGTPSGMTLPTVTPDYTKDDAPDAPDESSTDGNETESNTDNNTENTEKETESGSTDAAAQTTAEATETDKADKKGCGSVIDYGMVAVVLAGTVSACSVIAAKKKKED